MKRICIIIAAFTCLYMSVIAQTEPRTSRLLDRLDAIIADKAAYHRQREAQTDRLKAQALRARGMARVNLYKEIFERYAHYQTDSARTYLDKLAGTPEARTDAALQAYVRIGRGEILAVAGMYTEAGQELAQVDRRLMGPDNRELELFYYRTLRTAYGWMADYTEVPELREQLLRRTQLYRDSILAIQEPGLSRRIVEADNAFMAGRPAEAVRMLQPYAAHNDTVPNPYICFVLAQAYAALHDADNQLYYLALTAIADLEQATTEYQALPRLAQALYTRGDIRRAYTYLLCSMEDANFCKARLRSVEISNIFPIINNAYKQQEQEQRRTDRIFLYTLVGMLLVLSVSIVYLRKQMLRLRQLRREQHVTNQRLHEANEKMRETNAALQLANEKLQHTYTTLQQTDKIKEEYLARYLNRCRKYIDAIDQYRRTLLRLMKEKRTDELQRTLKSEAVIKEEQERFYADFDAAFLTLYPDFITKFNALLQPGEELRPKAADRLNTELRIFALIRLGVTETTSIAHFLNYSLATIYNYRSKIRHKAVCDNAEFESRVMQL